MNNGTIKTRIPEIGESFDYWTVLDNTPVHIKKGHWGVKCRCKCGKEAIIRITSLVGGKSKGCKCRTISLLKQKGNYIGDLSDTLYGRFIKGAKVRGISFDVSKEYLWNLFLTQERKCALSGHFIVMEKTVSRRKGEANITASLDRIDSSKGYEKGNVQWVHKDVNKMKQDLPEARFLQLCKMIAENYPSWVRNNMINT